MARPALPALLLALAFLPHVVELAQSIRDGASDAATQLAAGGVPASITDLLPQLASEIEAQAGTIASSIVTTAATLVTVALLATFLLFFLLRDGDNAWVWVFQAIGEQKRERITTAGGDALARVGGYLRGTIVLSAIIAVTDYVFMWVLGVPLALPLAVLAFLADGESWSSSSLALALGGSQRTVQRALETLAAAGKVQSFGHGRARRWTIPSVPGFTTTLLLPAPLSSE